MGYRTTAHRISRDQALRERIMLCAHTRVTEGGFAALTMQALAEDAGVATGSLYRHFRSKGELAAQLFARASQHEINALNRTLALGGTPVERLVNGLEQFAARAWSSRQLAYALIAEPVEPEVDEQRLIFREAYAQLFTDLLREGTEQGVFDVSHYALAAACLVGAIAESLVGPLSPNARSAREAGQQSLQLAEVSHSLVTFCLRAVGAKEPYHER
ncbi:TetR family transcriptional regulator [Pseudomonas marincola]|uniref:TetR family transcriptional regulator n=1 Tax=Pseudomonas marincola TaxID=437900 RepID=A0A653DZ23_9PSED|nr:TetR/AcrR family transcriptional regulator [Pseudomonas marincola]CAE6938563.1 TetR family transcriptional regulator [Pseudomonas marincola]